MRFSKKSQAAMEFLLNYGWVILIVIIIIGALAYYGVLKPKSLASEKCIFKAGFDCLDHSVARYEGGGGSVELKLLSSLGESATIDRLDFVSSGISMTCSNPSGTALAPGKAEYILFTCTGNIPKAEKAKFVITGKYHTKDPSFTKEIYGELTAEIKTIQKPTAGIELSLAPKEQWALKNKEVGYEISITNKGTGPDQYDVLVDGNLKFTTNAVKRGDTFKDALKLTFSSTGDYTTTIKAVSRLDPAKSDTEAATTHVTETPVYDFEMAVDPKAKLVNEGGNAAYAVTIRNKGFGGKLSLSAENVVGTATVTFDKATFDLASGASKSVTMTVKPLTTATKLDLKGAMQGATQTISGISAIIVCYGFKMNDLSAATTNFFNSKINFGAAALASKEDASYPDDVLPTSYKITVTGSAGTDTITVTDPANAKFNIVKTGLVSRLEVVPMVKADGTDTECGSKKATLNNMKNLDPDKLEIKQIWKVWDDGTTAFGASTKATPTTDEKFSGDRSLYVPALYGGITIPNVPQIDLSQADRFIFACKNCGGIWGAFDISTGGKLYYLGGHSCCNEKLICNQPPGRSGGFKIDATSYFCNNCWKLGRVSLDEIGAIPAGYACGNRVPPCPPSPTPCAAVPKPTTPLTAISINGWGSGYAYFDTIYFYSVKK